MSNINLQALEANPFEALLNAFPTLAEQCQHSSIGKLLPNALYIHQSALSALDPQLQAYERCARQHINGQDPFTLVKFYLDQPKLSYLFYPDFDIDPHPALHSGLQVDCRTGQVTRRDYQDSANPPILHRKETFVTPDYPYYQRFSLLTQQEEAQGLLNDPRRIGTLQGWRSRLKDRGLDIQQDHQVIQSKSTHSPKIERHRAAMVRTALSKPVRIAVEAGLFSAENTFFDYGCGHGSDIQHIDNLGYTASGWDPHYHPNNACHTADIVNFGYVINVIEDPSERREALLKAWELTHQALIVAAQVLVDNPEGQAAYSDGILTRRNTFQKYYEQEELKTYIDQVLGVDAIPVALGIYLVFRDQGFAESFRASRFRSRATTPRVRASVRRFEEYKELLTPLMAFMTEQGRLPVKEELPAEPEIIAQFGTLKRAFQVILQVTNVQEWDAIADKRRQDILVYLALSHFSRRPRFRELPETMQNNIKGLFGSYLQACAAADLMLTSLGTPEFIAACCQQSALGRLTASGLYVHLSALEELDPMLRLYEGCASRTIGRMAEATLIKFHTRTPKLSYLFYPDFDADPHPHLRTSMQIDLRDLQVSYRDYDSETDCPILHWKETYVSSGYPLREKFARLTRQETAWGLLDDPKAIFTSKVWQRHLAKHCAELKGHRLIWRKEADPYHVKILRSVQRRRVSN
jgi:DNA phosphorothioation-associated putative methyltransferase